MHLRPSERSRWSRCSGYPAFQALLSSVLPADKPSVHAWRGTVGHAICEEMLQPVVRMTPANRYAWSCDPSHTLIHVGGCAGRVYIHPEYSDVEYIVDAELITHIRTYLVAVANILQELGPKADARIEWGVSVSSVLGGTADAVIWTESRLVIVDAKFGQGVDVAAKNNQQLQCYAVAVHKALRTQSIEYVDLVIVQPALGGVKCSEHDISELHVWEVNIERETDRCKSSSRTLVAGSWCRWCPCVLRCPAQQKVLEEAVAVAEVPTVARSNRYDVLGEQLRRYEDVLLPYGKALRDQLHFALTLGACTTAETGWELVEKRSSRTWVHADAVLDLLQQHGVNTDDVFEHTLFSPAKLEKYIKRHGVSVDLAPLWSQKPSGTVLRRVGSAPKLPVIRGVGALP